MKDFSGKVVVIIGGSSGIGFALGKQFAQNGAQLLLASYAENDLQNAADRMKALGYEVNTHVCDVTDPEQIEALADYAWQHYGHVDVVLNNAGMIIPNAPMFEMPIEQVKHQMDVNFFGVWHGSSIFGKRFMEQGRPAAIYNTGSENSMFNGIPHSAPYIASKHAVLALTNSLREDMPDFVDVGLICPGFVGTELLPENIRPLGMNVDEFAEIAFKQIKAGEFYIVSHAYNIERINQRHEAISAAYEKYAPRYEGDDEYDGWTMIAKFEAES